MELRESQLEAAAMTLYAEMQPKDALPWDLADEELRVEFRRVASVLAPLVEPCWSLPDGEEMDEVTAVVDNAEDLGAIRSTAFAVAIAGFIYRRNRMILARIGLRA